MQLIVQVYLADYVKAYFGLGLGLITSGLGLGLGTLLPQAFGLGLELSFFFDPSSFAMTTSSSLPKAW